MKGRLFVHSSQQREERTKKHRRSYPCTFFITPSVLWTPPLYFVFQNTGEECGYIHCRRAEAFSALTPSPYGHSPYISSKTPRNATGHDRERGGLTLSLLLPVFSTPPSLRATSPIFCITKHRGGGLKCHAMP